MNSHSTTDPSNRISHILSTLNKYKLLWILPMILGMILSSVYAIALRKETWSSKQSLIVRDDLLGQSYKPGQFESLDSMKSAQETIFEIARKPQVIRNSLQQLGPPSKGFLGLGSKGYPSEEVIEMMQGNISFNAPNGAEFGRTEVIILNTKCGSRERAREFTKVLVGEIIAKANEVRQRKFQSMESEILQTCEAAESALEESRVKVREMDHQLGQDAGSMVAVGESAFRDDPLAREIAQLKLEHRVVQSDVEKTKGMLQSLEKAKQNPEAIVNISSDLTSRQPALDALKREMVQQKGAYALLSGRYTQAHPAVTSARDGINVMEKQIRLELSNAESDTRAQLGMKSGKLERLNADIEDLRKRVVALGEKRADSITLFADIKKRTEILNNARTNLAEIQGLASSENTDLLTTVDEVQVSTRPDGIGKKALVMCGGLGGLMLGMGLVMLLAPPPAPTDRQHAVLGDSPATSPTPNSVPQPPAEPALADVGLAKAQSGLAASRTVLQNLMGSTKRKPKEASAEEKEAEEKSQKIIDARLNSVKAKQSSETETPLETSLEPVSVASEIAAEEPLPNETGGFEAFSESAAGASEPESQSNNPFSRKEIETSKSKSALGAKIVPASGNPFKESSASKVDPAALVKSAAEQSTTAKLGSGPIEIPDLNEVPPENPPSGSINKMVDKAFEDELKSTTRAEAQTIQLSALSQAIAGSLNPPVAASSSGLAGFESKSEPVAFKETDFSEEVSTETASAEAAPKQGAQFKQGAQIKRGAQIKPRSANIRPVDLARQAESDDFDRVDVKGSNSDSDSETQPSKKPLVSTSALPNPFLKNRSQGDSKGTPLANEDGLVVPVPDQIRKLSDSIANFAKPFKGKGGSKKEKF